MWRERRRKKKKKRGLKKDEVSLPLSLHPQKDSFHNNLDLLLLPAGCLLAISHGLRIASTMTTAIMMRVHRAQHISRRVLFCDRFASTKCVTPDSTWSRARPTCAWEEVSEEKEQRHTQRETETERERERA